MQYLLLIYDNEAEYEKVRETEYPQWIEYSRRIQEAGILLGGNELKPGRTATTVRGKNVELSDGPFMETKEVLGGYFHIEVEHLDVALDWARQMPHVSRGGAVEVRPVQDDG